MYDSDDLLRLIYTNLSYYLKKAVRTTATTTLNHLNHRMP